MEAVGRISCPNALDLLLDAVCIVDAEGRYLYVSAAFETIFGYKPDEVLGRSMIELVHPEDRERTLQAANGIMAGQPRHHFENRYVRKDGRVVDIMWSARWSEPDRARIAVARDVTARKRAEALQSAIHALSEAAHAADGLPALCAEIHRIVVGILPAADFRVALYDQAKDAITFIYCEGVCDVAYAGPPVAGLIRSRRPVLMLDEGDGMSWLAAPMPGQGGAIGALVLRSHPGSPCYGERDMELLQAVALQAGAAIERRQMQDQLEHSAFYDPLTDLPNRRLFLDRLQTAMTLAKRDGGALSLMCMDLDLFKQVNDSFGHGVGDLLLQEVAKRLRQCVRESDTVGRVGGDEFLILLNGMASPDDGLRVAENVRAALAAPYDLAGRKLSVYPSIGIAVYPEHGDDSRQLIRCADEAMYRAKQSGGNCAQLWTA